MPEWDFLKRMDLDDATFISAKYIGILLLIILNVVPLLYAFSVSVKPPAEWFGDAHFLPKNPTIEPWIIAFDNLSGPLVNSVIIASGTAIISLLITVPGAYVFGRQNVPGKKFLFYVIIAALLFPYILLIIPIASVWNTLGLYNTIPGVWIAYQVFVTPFAVWILRDFFEKLPTDLEEAAQVYGCTQFQAFIKVILPLSLPGIVAVGFLAFLIGWGDFLFSSILTTGTGPRPAVVALFLDTAGGERVDWSVIMAETFIVGLPPTVIYMMSRRYLSNAFAV